IVTDHEAIPWLKKHKQPKGRLAWWTIHLSEYEPYNIIKRKGSNYTNVDALSRLETNPVDMYNKFIDYLLRHNYPPELTLQQKQKLARQATQYIVEN
ncbi:13608_t:CDS:2, partial [Dentiscutata erythropus]